MLLLSRPPLISSPRPSRTNRPSPRSRAASARAPMLTMAARSLASSPSGISGNSRKAMSVTTTPSTASPRNSSRSLLTGRSCSNACDRWVRASWRNEPSRNRTPRMRSSAFELSGVFASVTLLLDLDRLTAGVVAAVRAHPVRQLGLVALRALRVRRRLRLPVGLALGAAGVALASFRYRHRFLRLVSCRSGFLVGGLERPVQQGVQRGPPWVRALVPRTFAQIPIAAAGLAEPQAVGAAQRGERHLQAH